MIATTEQRQFFATKKRVIWFETIEIYHPEIGTMRYVVNQRVNKSFTLEDDAPRNAGETVEFMPVAASVGDPDLTSGVLTRTFNFSRVGTDVKNQLKLIDAENGGYIQRLEIVYRQYIDSTTAPANTPEYLFGSVSISGDVINITASDDQPASIRIAIIQNEQTIPGLRGVV